MRPTNLGGREKLNQTAGGRHHILLEACQFYNVENGRIYREKSLMPSYETGRLFADRLVRAALETDVNAGESTQPATLQPARMQGS